VVNDIIVWSRQLSESLPPPPHKPFRQAPVFEQPMPGGCLTVALSYMGDPLCQVTILTAASTAKSGSGIVTQSTLDLRTVVSLDALR